MGVSFLLMWSAMRSPMDKKNAGTKKAGLACTNSFTPGVKRNTPPIRVVIVS